MQRPPRALIEQLSQSLRVVVLRICGGTFESTEQSSTMDRLDAAIRILSSKGVVVVCTAHGHVTGAALLLLAAAHYRIVDAGRLFCVRQHMRGRSAPPCRAAR